MSIRLKDQVLILVQNCGMSDRELGELIDHSSVWASNFRKGRIKSPSVDVMQDLYEKLTGTPLLK